YACQPPRLCCAEGQSVDVGQVPRLATFRRKNDVSSGARVGPDRSGALPECALVLPGLFPSPEGSFFPAGGVRLYPFLRLAKTLPILMSVSATTPNPTHRSIPSSPR